jgi:hypothetical protein
LRGNRRRIVGAVSQLGATSFAANGGNFTYGLPRNANGEYPDGRASLLAPGAPRAA